MTTKNKRKFFRYPKGTNRFEFHDVPISVIPYMDTEEKPKQKIHRKRKHKKRRNNGFGKQLWWAIDRAIKHRYQFMSADSAYTYKMKAMFLYDWLKLQNINDLMNVTSVIYTLFQEDLKSLVEKVGYTPAYAVSIMNASNVVFTSVLKNKDINLSPSNVAKRSSVRKIIPFACNEEKMELAIHELFIKGKYISALRIQSMSDGGLRRKESTKMDARRMLNECDESFALTGRMQCRIIEGAKGGRGRDYVKSLRDRKGRLRIRFDRIIQVDQEFYTLIKYLANDQGDRECLVPDDLSPKQFYDRIYNDWYPIAKKFGLGSLHDIRAAYACRRYCELTGYPAPVKSGCLLIDKEIDKHAREIISQELGHKRIDVLAAYIGGMWAIKPIHKKKAKSKNQAYKQAFDFLTLRMPSIDIKNFQTAERASEVVRLIYKESKIGIFKIGYSDIQVYIKNYSINLSENEIQELKITLTFLIDKLYEESWKELLEDDFSNIINIK